MILILGGSGYIGQAFVRELSRRGWEHLSLSRAKADYTSFPVLRRCLKEIRPALVINCAGYTGRPNVDACETARAETLLGNTLLPQTIAQACEAAGIPWGHVSSGCIYTGAKVLRDGGVEVEKDLRRPDVWELVRRAPEKLAGFTEEDEPNFSFRNPPCSFYSGTKALAEEAIAGVGQGYIWRLRIPFDEEDCSRNFISKLMRYAKVYENANSLSHRGDFVRACLDMWGRKSPFGIYNVTNPGFTTAGEVVRLIEKWLKPSKPFEFWKDDEEFYRVAAKTPRSNCILDVGKLLGAGIRMRPVGAALEDALKNWKPEPGRGE